MDSLPTVFLSICSSAEYFVLALSPEYEGQLWIFSSLRAAPHAAPAASRAIPSHQSLFFMAAIIEQATRERKNEWKDRMRDEPQDIAPPGQEGWREAPGWLFKCFIRV
jgi:hypothetical protein